MKALLDNFAAIIGAITIALLLLSVSHEYGYFWIVGSRFQTFLSTTDYFSNAILWLPWLAVISYFYVDWDVLVGKRLYVFKLDWKNVTVALIMFGSPLLFFFFVGEVWPFGLILPFIFLWLFFQQKLPYADAKSGTLHFLHRTMVISPVVLALSVGWGLVQGQSALKSFDEPYTIVVKDGEKINRVLLRTFDKGLLVRDTSENRIEFIKWTKLNVSIALRRLMRGRHLCHVRYLD
jgi:hypothetical protein